MKPPETQYAKAGDLHIAYQVVGDGPIDLVFVPSWFSHVELTWEEPRLGRVLDRLSSFSRLLIFDVRGSGLSDPVPLHDPPTLEDLMDDIRAVQDAVGSERAVILGATLGGALAMLYAATHPERTCGLVLVNAAARYLTAPDYELGAPAEMGELFAELIQQTWGRPGATDWLPEIDERLKTWLPYYMRMAMSPGAAASLYRVFTTVDVRHVLPSVRVPTLVIHRADNVMAPPSLGRFVADRIPDARYVEVPGRDPLWFLEDPHPVIDEIEEFVTGHRPQPMPDRVLATVLFTDIVRSTETTADLGDSRWRDMLQAHSALVRRQLERFNGRLIKTTGDGILATFDGPARAIRAGVAIRDGVRSLGLEVRVGLHSGEVELLGTDVAGIAVNIASRVMSEAGNGDVLVSSTVKDLVVGSGIGFADRGVRTLKGVPGEWSLYAVTG